MQDTQRAFIVKNIRKWLTPKGIKLFQDYYDKYGRVDPVIFEGPIPHPVHFREGMAVRNQIRKICPDVFTSHELDDMWSGIVEEALQDPCG